MEVISTKYPGIWCICEQCGSVLANIKNEEIYENSYIYCPICHWKNKLNYDKSYDGYVAPAAKPIVLDTKVVEETIDATPNEEAAAQEKEVKEEETNDIPADSN